MSYSPTLGRFLEADPIGYPDGANRYEYEGDDPAALLDPTGMVARRADPNAVVGVRTEMPPYRIETGYIEPWYFKVFGDGRQVRISYDEYKGLQAELVEEAKL